MAENKTKKQDSFVKRSRKAYQRGYVNGFDDRSKLGGEGSRFWGTRGYSKGFGDKKKIDKIQRRVEKYRKEN